MSEGGDEPPRSPAVMWTAEGSEEMGSGIASEWWVGTEDFGGAQYGGKKQRGRFGGKQSKRA